MKGKGLLLLTLLMTAAIVGYLNLTQKKTMMKNVSGQLTTPVKNSDDIPAAVKNQLEENMKESEQRLEKE